MAGAGAPFRSRGPAPGPPPSPGGRVRRSGARREAKVAGTGAVPRFGRDDRRSLPDRVLSGRRVKGPLRRPRRLGAVHDAAPRAPVRAPRKPRRRARVAFALDPPRTPCANPTPRFPDAPDTPLTAVEPPSIILPVARWTSDAGRFADRPVSPSQSHWTTLRPHCPARSVVSRRRLAPRDGRLPGWTEPRTSRSRTDYDKI